jgi:glycosyltransferase involved in cell wall biosynthesis
VRILLLAEELASESLSPAGIWLDELIRRCAARGHRLQVIRVPGDSAAAAHERPGFWPTGVSVQRPTADQFEAALGRALTVTPDVVHVAGASPFGPRVREILSELPLLLDLHDYAPLCPNLDLVHRPEHEACDERFPFPGCTACAGLARIRRMEERAGVIAAARIVVAHSRFHRRRLEAELGERVERLEYGVDTLRFRPDPRPPRSPAILALWERHAPARVLLLGPATAARGTARLLDLLVALRARVPDVELVVAGSDPEHPDWRAVFEVEAGELGLGGATIMVPRVPLEDLPALYASCSVAIAPGRAPDPGGLFVLHAMAAGLPVVADPLGAMSEILADGEGGQLVDARDLGAFSSAVARLLLDERARRSLGDRGRLRAIERHDFERAVVALETLYERTRLEPRLAA